MNTAEREQALTLLDQLAPAQRTAALRFIESLLVDPVTHSLAAAPVDDEPITAEDRQRFHEGQAWFAQRGGQGVPMEDVLAEFGLRQEDFPHSS